MTDKQINTCEFLNICQTDCNGTLEDTEMCHCYELYKQLKRKEQECEALQMSENEAREIIAELKAECEALKQAEKNETMLISNLQDLWGRKIAEEQGDCKNIDYTKPATREIYNTISEIERTLKDVAFAQSIQMGKTKPLGETGSPRSYRNWENKLKNLLEREFLK